MTLVNEYEDDYSSGDDIGLSEEIAEITQACVPAGDGTSNGAAPTNYSDNDYEDDLEIARSVQNRLLAAGSAAAPSTKSDDDEESDIEYANRIKNLYGTSTSSISAVFDDDEEDDFEILRAIQKRFSSYDKGSERVAEEPHTLSPGLEVETTSSMISNRSDVSELHRTSRGGCNTTNLLTENVERQPDSSIESYKSDYCESSKLPNKRSGLPVAAQVLFDAIKKNRCFQKFLRTKMTEMEAKIEENKNLRDRAKYLKALHASCVRRTGHALSLKKDPHVQLISAKKSYSKNNDKRIRAMFYGPAENSHVINYRMVLERFPQSLDRKKWSVAERENLLKGIRQQFQEMVLQISVDRFSSECSLGEGYDIDNISASIKDLDITPEKIREFLPKVNWDKLAHMYIVGRTGAECEARISFP
ncbi:hypothetical protein L6164_008068 [Bauhinia variegata]|uniref:Uncharacterized protein n=1 Tax=Bauhinia variegata TaxID=167791 RepID=A0ACB9PL16_BAUVA|nr:hypothetical protein L6164_008068 [Bauhinia variegata]